MKGRTARAGAGEAARRFGDVGLCIATVHAERVQFHQLAAVIFIEAARALFAGDRARFEQHIEGWHRDARAHLAKLTKDAFEEP